jgi:hypothetical protein
MRTADAILTVIRDRGTRGLPLERVYRLLFNRDLYLRAYARLYPNQGAMTKGSTPETVDGMSLEKKSTSSLTTYAMNDTDGHQYDGHTSQNQTGKHDRSAFHRGQISCSRK